jgi:predicted GNAT superfamily acetyltransferase
MSAYQIRSFATMEEFRACVALQEETWGAGFSERVAPAILKVAQRLGGVSAGAWSPDGVLVGFVFGLTGVRGGEVVHWSDMLAVRRGLRDTGLGTELKAFQRRLMLERGVTKMHWTFDPLQSRNAYMNFAKLGIVVREYELDMYGETDSPLHRGIGTDRFIALWLMDSERTVRRMAGTEQGPTAEVLPACGAALEEESAASATYPRPGRVALGLREPSVRVAIPVDISAIMAHSMDLARDWRYATRSALTHYMGRGYEVRELVRGPRTSHYILTLDEGSVESSR